MSFFIKQTLSYIEHIEYLYFTFQRITLLHGELADTF